MTGAEVSVVSNFVSWGTDVLDRLINGAIDSQQANDEIRRRLVEMEDGLAAARGTIAASRATEDEARRKLPHDAPVPAPHVEPTPPVVSPPVEAAHG